MQKRTFRIKVQFGITTYWEYWTFIGLCFVDHYYNNCLDRILVGWKTISFISSNSCRLLLFALYYFWCRIPQQYRNLNTVYGLVQGVCFHSLHCLYSQCCWTQKFHEVCSQIVDSFCFFTSSASIMAVEKGDKKHTPLIQHPYWQFIRKFHTFIRKNVSNSECFWYEKVVFWLQRGILISRRMWKVQSLKLQTSFSVSFRIFAQSWFLNRRTRFRCIF